ncbi:hypothetical protein GGS23DRAFT_597339 [Durotheca rogersii]|uniref:uncharacterized protein n=1 Tax=Durotheca rogersii TaxID=419775 RepID=UPI0022203A6A|nr:uncharacterized protein GGS23DRAFT_597339 [Durotheca rogersii]KAI5862537.1 hypothetical protein GGS23DRAFT_597339 [Durotheca rogersii]
MSRLGAWFRASTPRSSSGSSPAVSQVDLRAQEIAQMEEAMIGAALIMNDDIDGAEERLRTGDSAFHHLGMGICTFMRSILGFEKAIMVEASDRLNQCETSAWNGLKKAQREAGTAGGVSEDRIYPPGSEFALVLADAQLMSAIVAVLHESLTEGLRGFYKLRKAYITVDGLMQSEAAYLKRKGLHSGAAKGQNTPSSHSIASGRGSSNDDTDDTDLEFVDADEAHSGAQTPLTYGGHLSKPTESAEEKLSRLSLDSNATSKPPAEKAKTPITPTFPNGFSVSPDSEIFNNPVDIFVHSGANMCFGSLLLILSMVPPAFSRLLSIIGFKGDRERGVQMLWQSSQFDNINGAVAGLMLLAYYNGLLSFSDILPSEEDVENGALVGYPRSRCSALIALMRSRYPDSGLWRFEEARVLGHSKDLRGSLKILKSNTKSKMRQVSALNNFETAVCSMYVHDFPDMRDNFLYCIELNDWSHALYYYMAGSAELESYRNAFHGTAGDVSRAQVHKKKAEELFRKAPTVAGKKRFLAKPLPFEQFVARKIQKWEDRSKKLGVDLADAVGVSPVEEMIFLWNGAKKMSSHDLEMSEKMLSWGRLTAPKEARSQIMAEIDEEAVRDVCRAAVARSLGKYDESRELLNSVLAMDKFAFKDGNRDDYPLPAANYEMAALAWVEVQKRKARKSDGDGSDAEKEEEEEEEEEEWLREKTEECQSWLEKVARWEAFILDARIGMRVQTGMDTIRWFKRERGSWSGGDDSSIPNEQYKLIRSAITERGLKLKLRHFGGNTQTALLMVQTLAHEELHHGLYDMIISTMQALGLVQGWTSFVGNPEADMSGGPSSSKDAPSLVIHAGDSSSMEQLEEEMEDFFTRTNPRVNLSIIVKIYRHEGMIRIGKWEEEFSRLPEAAADTAGESPDFTVVQVESQKIQITRTRAHPPEFDVSGPLELDFKKMFRRPRQPGEVDVVVSVNALKYFARKVWLMDELEEGQLGSCLA